MTREEKVKNVVLVGQAGVGKTMVAEAMLHLTGKTSRLGGHAGTKPTLDYDGQEGARGFSISTTIAPVQWDGTRINMLDAPCYPDFVGDAYAAMSAGETALFVVDAIDGPQTTTTRLWYAAEDLSIARAVFVNRLDKPEADFDVALDALRERFGNRLGAVTIPMGTGDAFSGVIDVLHLKARHLEGGKVVEQDVPAEYADAAQAAHDELVDLVAEADDEIMMKYLEGEELTKEELEGLLGIAIRDRVFVPVFAGVAVREEGITSLMTAIVDWFPTMADFGRIPLVNGEQLDISPDDDRPVAFVFKSLNDPQNGKLSFIKVLAGTVTPGLELTNARTRKSERLGHLYLMTGRETTDVKRVVAGDICVVPKLDALTGDTLSVTGKVEAAAFRFPNSLYRIAIEPDTRGVEGKLYAFLEKAPRPTPPSGSSATRRRARRSSPPSARRRSPCCSSAWRIAPTSRPTPSSCASRTARPSVAPRRATDVTRSRPVAPASLPTAACASSQTPTKAMSSWTRSWAVPSRAASSPPSTRASRRP